MAQDFSFKSKVKVARQTPGVFNPNPPIKDEAAIQVLKSPLGAAVPSIIEAQRLLVIEACERISALEKLLFDMLNAVKSEHENLDGDYVGTPPAKEKSGAV